jgi:hypothetical protein
VIKFKASLKFITLLLAIISLLSIGNYLYAQSISGNELVDNAHFYDKRTIQFQGEVIGDIMFRKNHAWINVNDGSKAIGVWGDSRLMKNIEFCGSYRHIGDTVKVIGVFNRSCPQHGGDLDIHASEISIIEKGYEVDNPVNPNKIWIAFILFLGIVVVVSIPQLIKLIKLKP